MFRNVMAEYADYVEERDADYVEEDMAIILRNVMADYAEEHDG
jgi:hypothetical protein